MKLLGLRTVIYPAPDLAESKKWWSAVLGYDPYFDKSFYVGFLVQGYELALRPAASAEDGPITYWGVANVDIALRQLLEQGAKVREGATDVGGGIRVATVTEVGGSIFGVIENPTYEHVSAPLDADDGPGR
ncbi:VOC family protein [Microbacterium sp. P02]|uniref:VOC family protein n=1 Tax=unclassified Microbacterium TaxID=2609290 RepID=UPI00366E03D4